MFAIHPIASFRSLFAADVPQTALLNIEPTAQKESVGTVLATRPTLGGSCIARFS